MSKIFVRNQREIDGFASGYPFKATTHADEPGIEFRNVAVSRKTSDDVRTWRFRTEQTRDEFVATVLGAESA